MLTLRLRHAVTTHLIRSEAAAVVVGGIHHRYSAFTLQAALRVWHSVMLCTWQREVHHRQLLEVLAPECARLRMCLAAWQGLVSHERVSRAGRQRTGTASGVVYSITSRMLSSIAVASFHAWRLRARSHESSDVLVSSLVAQSGLTAVRLVWLAWRLLTRGKSIMFSMVRAVVVHEGGPMAVAVFMAWRGYIRRQTCEPRSDASRLGPSVGTRSANSSPVHQLGVDGFRSSPTTSDRHVDPAAAAAEQPRSGVSPLTPSVSARPVDASPLARTSASSEARLDPSGAGAIHRLAVDPAQSPGGLESGPDSGAMECYLDATIAQYPRRTASRVTSPAVDHRFASSAERPRTTTASPAAERFLDARSVERRPRDDVAGARLLELPVTDCRVSVGAVEQRSRRDIAPRLDLSDVDRLASVTTAQLKTSEVCVTPTPSKRWRDRERLLDEEASVCSRSSAVSSAHAASALHTLRSLGKLSAARRGLSASASQATASGTLRSAMLEKGRLLSGGDLSTNCTPLSTPRSKLSSADFAPRGRRTGGIASVELPQSRRSSSTGSVVREGRWGRCTS
eukprot:TRINITY_DN5839_c0_g1_i1.p1 TRINITY_DN5839_c0_g1~~TRINITY_DN5839_c0_g1_i1.p1  ORF type:complete len:567 (+),score=73.68 TRINITY_DN5839_c0_g1_i1:148-1848(+)